MPYLLPADPDISALDCVLVFFPDAPEYRRALFGQIAELTDVWNWEGTQEEQAIARQAWLLAELETLENMTCLDELVTALTDGQTALNTRLDAIVSAIEAQEPCCDDGFNSIPDGVESVGTDDEELYESDTDIAGDVIPPEFEDVPAFQQYLCGAAEQAAAAAPELANRVEDILRFTSDLLIVATLMVLAFGNLYGIALAAVLVGGARVISLTDILVAAEGIFDLRSLIREDENFTGTTETISEVTAMHDDIVEAIACANSASEAASNLSALFDGISNAGYRAIYKLAHSTPMMGLIFAGLSNAPDSTDCNCSEFDIDVTFTFDAGNEGWGVAGAGGGGWHAGDQAMFHGRDGSNHSQLICQGLDVYTKAGGISGTYKLELIEFDIYTNNNGTSGIEIGFTVSSRGNALFSDLTRNLPVGHANRENRSFPDPHETDIILASDSLHEVFRSATTGGSNTADVYYDNVRICLNHV